MFIAKEIQTAVYLFSIPVYIKSSGLASRNRPSAVFLRYLGHDCGHFCHRNWQNRGSVYIIAAIAISRWLE